MGCLRLESVTYRRSLRDVSLTVAAGKTVGVLVSHKVDRAALSNLCAGIATPESGTVRVEGRLVFARQVWPGMSGSTVLEQLSSALLACEHTWRAAQAVALGLLAEWGVEQWSARDLDELEEHELVQLSLLRALAVKPDVLLLDDPTAGYGNQLIDIARKVLETARSEGCAVLVATSRVEPTTATTDLYRLEQGTLRSSRRQGGEIVEFPRVRV
jgi:ABC-type branched-subunit amino acid transport system ATPase component